VLGEIDLDPCSNSKTEPNIPAHHYYTIADNGLLQDWFGRVYMNPPYGREIAKWVRRLVSEYDNGNVREAIALVPARTDTAWFRLLRDGTICFIDGRLHFSNSKDGAPFPSAAIYLGKRVDVFDGVFSDIGDVWKRRSR